MAQDMGDFRAQFIFRAAVQQDRLTVQADFVRRHHLVSASSLGQGDAVVKTEQLGGVASVRQAQCGGIGPLLDHDLHVAKLIAKLSGESIPRLFRQPVERLCIHTSLLYREVERRSLAVVHGFGADVPAVVDIPLPDGAWKITDMLHANGDGAVLADGMLHVALDGDFTAAVVHLTD